MNKNKIALLAGLAGVVAGAAAATLSWLKYKSEETYYIDISDDVTILDDEYIVPSDASGEETAPQAEASEQSE